MSILFEIFSKYCDIEATFWSSEQFRHVSITVTAARQDVFQITVIRYQGNRRLDVGLAIMSCLLLAWLIDSANIAYRLYQNAGHRQSNMYQIQIQIRQLFLLRPLQSDRWRITEVSQHVFHSRRQTEIKMFWESVW